VVNSIRDLHQLARKGAPRTIAVACAHDEDVLASLDRAAADGLVHPLLIGRRGDIEALRARLGLERLEAETLDCSGDTEAVELAVRTVAGGRAQMLMKGLVATSVFLKGVLNKEWGLRKRALLSHVGVFEIPDQRRLLLVTDVAMSIAPDLAQKAQILENAVELAHRLGRAASGRRAGGGGERERGDAGDDRRGCAGEDGRPRADQGVHRRRAARARQRARGRGRAPKGHHEPRGRVR
jgi:phosphate butyryltransferase